MKEDAGFLREKIHSPRPGVDAKREEFGSLQEENPFQRPDVDFQREGIETLSVHSGTKRTGNGSNRGEQEVCYPQGDVA
jgi:hypothetical protein